MKYCGSHYIADMVIKDYSKYDVEKFMDLIKRYLITIGYTILDENFYYFDTKYAWTMIFVLAESHISVHSYPENNIISIDFYSCKVINMEDFENKLKIYFDNPYIKSTKLFRGVDDDV